MLQDDRNFWIQTVERQIERVQKGAIYFIGRILWTNERIENINYPISHILKIFLQIVRKQGQKFSIINEILRAVKQLVMNKQGCLYFEWQTIVAIIDSLSDYCDILVQKKRIEYIVEIFKVIKTLIVLQRFPEEAEGMAIRCYIKYKNLKGF